jgi:hypothetical protein
VQNALRLPGRRRSPAGGWEISHNRASVTMPSVTCQLFPPTVVNEFICSFGWILNPIDLEIVVQRFLDDVQPIRDSGIFGKVELLPR